MAEVSINYKGKAIAEMNESGTKTLKTSGQYCEGDIAVTYIRPSVESDEPAVEPANYKKFFVTVPTAVASTWVTVVAGDPDVAEHYADEAAVCTVRKVSNNDTNGTILIMGLNHSFNGRYGMYAGYNAANDAVSALVYNHALGADGYTDGQVRVRCTVDGDIIVRAGRQQTNFGGADYIVEFSW